MQLLVLGLTPREEEALRCAFGTEFTMVFVSDPQKGKALLSNFGFDALFFSPAAAEDTEIAGKPAVLLGGEEKDAERGFFVIADTDPASLSVARRYLIAASRLLANVHRENTLLHRKLDEISLCNRAKAILMKTLGFSEDQAHKHLEKQAMRFGVTRGEIAKRILATYEN